MTLSRQPILCTKRHISSLSGLSHISFFVFCVSVEKVFFCVYSRGSAIYPMGGRKIFRTWGTFLALARVLHVSNLGTEIAYFVLRVSAYVVLARERPYT